MKLHAKTLAGLEDLVAQDMNQAGPPRCPSEGGGVV